MDLLYYSNYCKHSQKVVNFFVKNNLTHLANFICIDKRKVDPNTGQTTVLLENGTEIMLPPNIHSVPALMLVKDNYRIVYGSDIMGHYGSEIKTQMNDATSGEGEPSGFSFGTSNGDNIVSEKFTFFGASPEDLSAKGSSQNRQMHHYVPAGGNASTINTPPDTYRPNKLSENVTVDSLQQQRNEEIAKTNNAAPPFMPQKTL
jgi:hypothetical protein